MNDFIDDLFDDDSEIEVDAFLKGLAIGVGISALAVTFAVIAYSVYATIVLSLL